MGGEGSRGVAHEGAAGRRTARLLRAPFVLVPGAGHLSMLVAPRRGAPQHSAARRREAAGLLADPGTLPGAPLPPRVAYDPPCHLLHAQRVGDPPRAVLAAVPHDLTVTDGALLSTRAPLGARLDKAIAWRETGCVAVDMESAAVAGFARDAAVLVAAGWRIGPVTPVDPFFNVNTPDDLAEANRLADDLGIDSISAGGCIAWAIG